MGVLECGVGGLYRQEIRAYLVVNQTDFDPNFARVRCSLRAREVRDGGVSDDVILGMAHLAVRERGERPWLGWSWAGCCG